MPLGVMLAVKTNTSLKPAADAQRNGENMDFKQGANEIIE